MKKIVVLMLLFSIFLTCKKKNNDMGAKEEGMKDTVISQSDKRKEIKSIIEDVLGNSVFKFKAGTTGNNPYSVKNIQEAVDSLMAWGYGDSVAYLLPLSNGGVEATHIYLRFEPVTESQWVILGQDTSFQKYDVPLEFMPDANGQPYVEPCEGEFAYQYASLPIGHPIPNVPYTVRDSLFKLSDEMEILMTTTLLFTGNFDMNNDFMELLIDELMPDYDELILLYQTEKGLVQQKIVKGIFSKLFKVFKKVVKAVIKVTVKIVNAVITVAKTFLPWGAFPSGYVKLADDNSAISNVTVLTFNFGLPVEVMTNESGYFYMPVKFLVGSLFYVVYSNKQCIIRQWHNVNAGTVAESVFKLPFAARHYDGWTNIGQMNNGMTIRVNGIQASMWTHIVRGIGDYYKYAAQDNIKTIKERLTVFANYTNGESASSTPLISKVIAEGHFFSWSKYIDIVRFPYYVVADLIAPDLILSFKTTADIKSEADRIAFYCTIFHELGHSSHFKAIGALSYVPLYVEAIKGYGEKNGIYAGYIAQGESWAEFLGQRYINRKYPSLSSNKDYMKQYSEEYSDEKYTGTKWIPYGVWYDLIDNHIDEVHEDMPEVIDDKVNAYTLQEVYNAFGPGQRTPQIYRDQLLQKYNHRQRCEVLKLYHSYGYGDSYDDYNNPDIIYTLEWKPFPLLDKFIESFRHVDVCGTERIFRNNGDIVYNTPIIDAALYNYRSPDGSMIKVWTKTIDNQTSDDGRSYRVDSIRFLNKTGNVVHSYKPDISNFLIDYYFKFR